MSGFMAREPARRPARTLKRPPAGPFRGKPRLLPAVIAVLALVAGCDRAPSGARESLPGSEAGSSFQLWPGSNLPLVFLDTSGAAIPDEPKIPVRVRIIPCPAGGLAHIDSPDVEFDGAARIELRGKTSLQFPKKQFGFRLASPATLLGLPRAANWVLYGPYSDKSLIRDDLAYELSRRIGRYAPRTRFVELFLDDSATPGEVTSHYVGVYMLVERVEVGPGRVNVAGESAFLMKIDKPDADEIPYVTERGTRLIHVFPRTDPAGPPPYSERFMEEFESALASPAFDDPRSGFRRWIDEDSFADYFLLNELFRNVDAYRISTWFHRNDGGKLTMGPVWDFNLAFGNCSFGSASGTRGWVSEGVPDSVEYPAPFWWKRLLESTGFRRLLGERWRKFRGGPLATSEILAEVDRKAALLSTAQQRNFERWAILGRRVWPNPTPVPPTWEAEISQLQEWLKARAEWMDGELSSF